MGQFRILFHLQRPNVRSQGNPWNVVACNQTTFDGVPNFEESHSSRSSLTSEEDLSDESETVHDISVPLVPNNDTDVSFEAEHDLNVPLVLEDDKIETEPSFETVFPRSPEPS
ncbi:hypothetical protein S245_052164 [Arachis hypogaea]|uniref:Uncharacterized protein n=1 Tax=Arachis hypogaea TaxID=3818 RepID=A0A444Z4G1_ARAHY|nr:uncharacterized protein DS421_15g502420 [Arachis hypogaea]RYR09088.1 hypothetical protein Ahy_B05g077167 [Arachis hypogaea]